jgi:hypothetical protein
MGFDPKYNQHQMFLLSVGPVCNFMPDNMEKDYLSSFLCDEFYEWVVQQINKYVSYCQKYRPNSK